MQATLPELQAIATVARLGGFRAAARELGVSSSALSHAVSGLEQSLGVRLFNRTTRSVALTAAGAQLVADVGPALTAIDEALEHASEQRKAPSGTLRLNMAAGAARILLPLLLEYLRRYPAMQMDIVTESALVDVMGRGFDAGVRLGEMVPPDMIAVPILPTMRSIVVGAPAYLQGRKLPQTPQDLLQHQCIRMRLGSGKIYHWEFADMPRSGKIFTLDVPGPLLLDEGELIRGAAVRGMGLAYMSEETVADDLAAGRLVQMLHAWTPPYPGLCLYYAGRKHLPAKLKALVELIRERSDATRSGSF
jgi:DNA-binding transcriptional LysR family regulator